MRLSMGTVVIAIMLAGGITACSAKEPTGSTTAAQAAEVTEATVQATGGTTEKTTGETAGDAYRTGLAIVSSLKKSKDAGERDGNAQVDSVIAAVVLDKDGVIVDCVIDTAQTVMAFSAEGKVITPLDTEFLTKKDLNDGYGMRQVSQIGKEWYEQIASLEEYVIGKTIDEVTGIAVTEDSVPKEEDLASSVTVKIGDYIEAITQAAETAKVIGTKPGDKLGLGVVTSMSKSKDAADGKDGQCQAYSNYIVVTSDVKSVITGCIIDATQGTVTFDESGMITADLTAGVKTKRQLGDAYGMRAASQIGKEWFEQAAAMEGYVTGKTVVDVDGIAVDETGRAADVDLAAGVTIAIGDYQTGIVRAIEAMN